MNISVPTLLQKLASATGAPVRTDEIEALQLFAREDKRQVAQICQACGLDMHRLHRLYGFIEQACRKEPNPSVAIASLMLEMHAVVAAEDAEREKAEAERRMAERLAAEAEAARKAAEKAEADRRAAEEAAEAAGQVLRDPTRLRPWLAEWLGVPEAFVAVVEPERLVRIRARAKAPMPEPAPRSPYERLTPHEEAEQRAEERARELARREDMGRLALFAQLIELRQQSNLARCLPTHVLDTLHVLLGPTPAPGSGAHPEEQMARLRSLVSRPAVMAELMPFDLPDFGIFATLFSDLERLFDGCRRDEILEVKLQLHDLRQVDDAARKTAVALNHLAAELELPAEALADFHDPGLLKVGDRLPLDDVFLTPHRLGVAWFLSGLLTRAPDRASRDGLLKALLARYRADASMLDALGQLVARAAARDLVCALRYGLGLPPEGASHTDVEAALGREDMAAAAVALRDVPDHEAGKVLLLCRTAYALHKGGLVEDSEGFARRALRIAPREPLALRAIARLRMETGHLDDARRVLQVAFRANGDDPKTNQMIAEVDRRLRGRSKNPAPKPAVTS